MNVVQSYKELIRKASEAERKGDTDTAVRLYRQAVKTEPSNEYPYDRLMIIYRKRKLYKEELKVINEGVKYFETFHDSKQKQLLGSNRKIVELSNAFMKRVGLKDNKGKNIYYPEPIPRWLKRKDIVEKKLKQGTK